MVGSKNSGDVTLHFCLQKLLRIEGLLVVYRPTHSKWLCLLTNESRQIFGLLYMLHINDTNSYKGEEVMILCLKCDLCVDLLLIDAQAILNF